LKRMLVVAYFFPPLGGVGMLRTLRLVRHLSDIGWEAEVLTVASSGYPYRDEDALALLPSGLPVHRVNAPDPEGAQVRLGTSLPGKAGRWLLTKHAYPLLYVPDPYAPWARAAHLEVLSLLATGRYDLVYCSVPPHSAGCATASAAHAVGVPLVLDFRDLWVSNHYNPPRTRLKTHRRLERSTVSAARELIGATEGVTSALVDAYPAKRSHAHTVHNGFDASLLPPRGDATDATALRIVYPGSLYQAYDLEGLVQGLVRFRKHHPETPMSLRVLGELTAAQRRSLTDLALDSSVICLGRCSYRAALQEIAQADCMLAFLGGIDDLLAIPAKVYDAIALGRPVLFVGPAKGEAHAILSSAGVEYRAQPGDPDSVLRALEAIHSDKLRGETGRAANVDYIARFDMARQIVRFGEVFDSALDGRPDL
jgi:glycosyltransferase involved in cell wall biosynthesis